MKKVIYAKFSRERRPEFQISTRIAEENGKKTVEKSALCAAARPHIEKLAENEKKLARLYGTMDGSEGMERGNISDTFEIAICPCSLSEEGTALFPFEKGKSVESLLTEAIACGKFEKVREITALLWKILNSARGLQPFVPTDRFREIFGEEALPEGVLAAPVSNLDMIFANLLLEETEDGRSVCHLVDYEWVFDFPVPLSFIFARSLMLHGAFQTLNPEQQEALYAIGGVMPAQAALYYGMEVNFQKYVTGKEELYVLSRLYPKMKTCSFFLDYWKTAHVYYCARVFGALKEEPQKREELHFSLHFQGEVKETAEIVQSGRYQELILKPADTGCILRLYEITGIRDGKQEAAEITGQNAQVHYEDIYHFLENPEIHIKNNGYEQISFSYMVYHRDDDLIREGIELRLQNARLQKRLNLFIWPYKAVRKACRFFKKK